MKKLSLLLACLALAAGSAFAAETETVIDENWVASLRERGSERSRAPKLDPKRIINDSNSFLKEREPEMTAEEYALHEKAVTLLAANPEFGLRLLEAMINEKEKPSPAFEFILGNAYYATGQPERAEAYYRSAVNRFPSFLRAWNNLGVLYYTNGRFAEAIKCFSKSVSLGDREPTTFGLLGYSLEKEDNLVSAEVAYMQALAGDPANPDWKEGLLRICILGKQLARAESLVRTLIKEQPKEKRFWLTYANILLTDGRKIQATAILEVAAGAGIAGPEELNLLGDLYAEQQLIPEALAIYQRITAPSPALGERKLLHLARVLVAGGKLTEAEQALAAVGPQPSDEGRRVLLQARADIFAGRKQWAEARRELEALLMLAPLDGRALIGVGRAYAAEHDEGRAAFAFEAAYRVPATTYHACLELANLEIRRQHYAKSVEYLEKALSIEKTDTVQDYLARVKSLVPKNG